MKRAAQVLVAVLGVLSVLSSEVRADEHGLDAQARLEIELSWLEGNLERVAEYETKVASTQDLLCLAIRDLYWRPDPAKAKALRSRYALRGRSGMNATAAEALVARRWEWLLQETREAPWPVAADGEIDPWQALSLLIQDRQRREQLGYAGYPGRDPISVHVTKESARGDTTDDRRLAWLSYAGDEFGRVYSNLPESAEERDAKAEAASLRARNKFIGIVGLLALVILSLVQARRIKLDT